MTDFFVEGEGEEKTINIFKWAREGSMRAEFKLKQIKLIFWNF